MGRSTYRLTCTNEKFPSWKKVVDRIDFVTTCKMDAKKFKGACETLNIFDQVRSTAEFSTDDGVSKLTKKTPGGSAHRTIPIEDVVGKSMDIELSSRHFEVASKAVVGDEIGVSLSGRKSIGMLNLGGGVRMYFVPFQ